MSEQNKKPDWYDETKLKHVFYAESYMGYVIDLGDGTCRYANAPLLGADPGEQGDGSILTEAECDAINRAAPRWGDRVPLIEVDGGLMADKSRILERYEP